MEHTSSTDKRAYHQHREIATNATCRVQLDKTTFHILRTEYMHIWSVDEA
jgi:hypothetical protein